MSIGLRQDQRLSITQKQELKLVASPQLRLFLKLLQKPQLELREYISQELKENPVLVEAEIGVQEPLSSKIKETKEEIKRLAEKKKALQEKTDKKSAKEKKLLEDRIKKSYEHLDRLQRERIKHEEAKESSGDNAIIAQFDSQHFMEYYSRMRGDEGNGVRHVENEPPLVETIVSKGESLADHLLWQLRLSDNTPQEMEIGQYIIGNLDANGYMSDLTTADVAATLEVDEDTVERVRRQIMEFDPVGCAATSARECLAVQVKAFFPENKLLLRLVEDFIDLLEAGKYDAIETALGIDRDTLIKLVNTLRQLDPHPGAAMSTEAPGYITPDVFVYREGKDYRVVVNDDGLPKLRISSYYERVLSSRTSTPEEKEYIRSKIQKALDLIKSIRQRQQTLKQITESIVRFQRRFFDKGTGYLEPLRQKDVAEDIGVHESTVSRATVNRYVYTPRGLLPLKFFFNSGVESVNGADVSSTAVQAMIKTLVEKEDPKNPLTDDQISEILMSRGIKVARRTVAKYRAKMKIASSSRRKKIKGLI